MAMVPINPWLMQKAGKTLAEMFQGIAEADFKEEMKLEAEHRKKQADKEFKKEWERIRQEEIERKYKEEHPHCTWLFNHFEMGDYWFKVNYRW